ncbi:ulp1 protease family, C-terminal catalytic domain-containing protein [Tanacetum coccineum]
MTASQRIAMPSPSTIQNSLRDIVNDNEHFDADQKEVKTLRVPFERETKVKIPAWTEHLFYFPWANDDTFFDINSGKVYWESANVEVVDCLIRSAEANWAIAGLFFNTFMLSEKVPFCYVDGVTYGVPWFAKYVEKVYFSINAEDVHCILTEFHITSGVITIYDSLAPKSDVEDQKWWLAMRECYAYKLPEYLLHSEVLEKKNINPTNYPISFYYADNVPRQGNLYGDCGIWVMRNFYRLVNNLSLEVTLGWLLEEIHVTWAHLEKKRSRLRLYTKPLEEYAYNVPDCSKGEVQDVGEIDFSKVASTDVIDASKDVPVCSKGKVQDVGETDVSKVAATDVTDVGKRLVI